MSDEPRVEEPTVDDAIAAVVASKSAIPLAPEEVQAIVDGDATPLTVSVDEDDSEVVWEYAPPSSREGASLHRAPRGPVTRELMRVRGLTDEQMEQSGLYRRAKAAEKSSSSADNTPRIRRIGKEG